MSSLPTYEAFAAATSVFLSGTIMGVSMLAVPVALQVANTDDALVQQWRTIFYNGHRKGPIFASVVGTAMATIAIYKHQQGQDPTTSMIASVAAFGIVPYTWLVMNGVNNRLHSIAAGTDWSSVNVRNSVVTWSRMNAARGALPLVGGLVSLWGIMSQR